VDLIWMNEVNMLGCIRTRNLLVVMFVTGHSWAVKCRGYDWLDMQHGWKY
jgi:hypothetical protein